MVQIRHDFSIDIYGYSGLAVNSNFGATGFRLMDKMWNTVKTNQLKHKGINIWVYDGGKTIFTGLELETSPLTDVGLEFKKVRLKKYAWYKHIGPYQKLNEAYELLNQGIKNKGLKAIRPHIEIYGHWQPDESLLETELLIGLE